MSAARMPLLLRATYRGVLALYPSEFRRHAGPQLLDGLREGWMARRRLGSTGALRFALTELLDLMRNLAMEWRSPSGLPPSHRAARARWLDTLRQDVRFGLRSLRREPLFAATVILVAGLGIGANVVVYSMVDGILLEPLPYPSPERLVYLSESFRGTQSKSVSFPNYADWVARNDSFTGLAARTWWSFTVTGLGPAREIRAMGIAPQLLDMLDVQPARGRPFTAAENAAGEHVVLVSDGFWRGDLGSDPSVVGRTLTLDAEPWVVVGVLPAGLEFPLDGPAVWAPVRSLFDERTLTARGSHPGLSVIGRLRAGVDREVAQADLDGIAEQLAAEYPETNAEAGVRMRGLRELIVSGPDTMLWMLQGAVLLVLLGVCANVASLMLARATRRGGEMAVRAALGAGRGRLARQLLVEGWILALLASGLGLVGAGSVLSLVRAVGLADLPRLEHLDIDGSVIGFALAAACVTGLLFSLVPALRVGGLDAAVSLRGSSGRGVVRAGNGGRSALVVVQVALAMTLLVAAGLMVRSLLNLLDADAGLRTEGVLTAYVGPPQSAYPESADRARLYRALIERVRSRPGVEMVAGVDPLPLGGYDRQWSISNEGFPQIDEAGLRVDVATVTPGYFRTMEIPMLAGRDFDEGESPEAPPVIVDETLARFLWPEDPAPLGRRLRYGGNDPWRTVVGVVGHVKNYGVREGSRYQIYNPYDLGVWGLSLVVRSERNPAQLVPEIRAELGALDPELPLTRVATMHEYRQESVARENLTARTLAGFALAAVLVAVLGLYGVIACSVALRTREIGIRMALGAGRIRVLGGVVREGLLLGGIGVVLGAIAARFATRLLGDLLYGVGGNDATVPGGVAALLLGVTLVASLLPARRASRVDPGIALRED